MNKKDIDMLWEARVNLYRIRQGLEEADGWINQLQDDVHDNLKILNKVLSKEDLRVAREKDKDLEKV